ncbi:GNAT family N-acetyltransferase [Actinoplanes sp. CA-015351]|uniref:GNAT family N-acetyltransferase n=1 Tax=Actinoplanes sp. CA-015351 TaxID=3239897 RepID=UPI003D97A599
MEIRPAVVADADALAEVHVLGWQAAYRGMMPQKYLDGLSVADRADGWRSWLATIQPPQAILVLDPGVAGFITVGADDEEPGVGRVYAIYVRPGSWGQGRGQALMAAGVRQLASSGSGFSEATLWVLEANVRARRFYQAAGWFADGGRLVDESRGFPLEEIRYRRRL